ncbi:MAG TPA: RDD family protein [Solirubrobacterales bacterium]|nr:RDD family protein [Solirubrobacterales bacterium]
MESSGSLPPRPRPSIPARIAGAGARGAQRAAELTGIDSAVQIAAEEAIVRAAESPAVERALVRVLQGPAVREATAGALSSAEVERAVLEALDSELVDRVWARLLDSEQTQLLVERIAEAPEVRAALAYQGVGLVEDIGRQLGRVARHLDDLVERVVWRLTRKPRRTEPARQAGAVTRILAFAIDVVLLNATFFLGSALVAFVLRELFSDSQDVPTGAILAGTGAWLIGIGTYLVAFWSLAGETPGMRFLGLRLDAEDTHGIGLRRAVRRLIGFGVSALTLGLGFAGILLGPTRRGLPDRMADTEVLYVARRGEPAITRNSAARPTQTGAPPA